MLRVQFLFPPPIFYIKSGYNFTYIYTGVIQWLEASSDTRVVGGPNPPTSTIGPRLVVVGQKTSTGANIVIVRKVASLCGIKPNLVRQWFAKPPVSGTPLCPFKSDVPRQLFIYGGKRDVYRSSI